jgi:hypothetical protein
MRYPMRSNVAIKSILAIFVCLIVAGTASAQKKRGAKGGADEGKPPVRINKGGAAPPSGAGFYVSRIEAQPNRFSLLLSDENNRTAYTLLTINQLVVFETVLIEAQKFAETEEAVGVAKPQITRFVDKQEQSMIVDVSKGSKESQFHVTLQGLDGRVTVNAGKIIRGNKDKVKDKEEEPPLIVKMISAIEQAKTQTESR